MTSFDFLLGSTKAFLISIGLAGSPLYEGLPETLPADVLEQGPVSFSPVKDPRHRTPLGSRFVINGEEVYFEDVAKISEVFGEEHWAKLPRASQIEVGQDRRGREIWNYPVGTQIFHRIMIRSEPVREFELRLIEKRADENWAYGLYAWEDGFVLKKYRGFEPFEFEAKLDSGKQVKVSLERINLNACQQCHMMFTLDRHQYEGADRAGPCGFTPSNAELKKDWATRYAEKHGYVPFK